MSIKKYIYVLGGIFLVSGCYINAAPKRQPSLADAYLERQIKQLDMQEKMQDEAKRSGVCMTTVYFFAGLVLMYKASSFCVHALDKGFGFCLLEPNFNRFACDELVGQMQYRIFACALAIVTGMATLYGFKVTKTNVRHLIAIVCEWIGVQN